LNQLPIGFNALRDAVADARRIMADELCMQRRMDQQWGNLLGTMAPACIDADQARSDITQLINGALVNAGGQSCPDLELPIPPTVAESVSVLNQLRPWIPAPPARGPRYP
jgi:hypothetical protein